MTTTTIPPRGEVGAGRAAWPWGGAQQRRPARSPRCEHPPPAARRRYQQHGRGHDSRGRGPRCRCHRGSAQLCVRLRLRRGCFGRSEQREREREREQGGLASATAATAQCAAGFQAPLMALLVPGDGLGFGVCVASYYVTVGAVFPKKSKNIYPDRQFCPKPGRSVGR